MNVSHAILPHLKDDFLCIIRHVEGCIRKTNLIVVIALGFVSTIGCSQDIMNHVLGCCLTIRTSHSNNINLSLFKIVGS